MPCPVKDRWHGPWLTDSATQAVPHPCIISAARGGRLLADLAVPTCVAGQQRDLAAMDAAASIRAVSSTLDDPAANLSHLKDALFALDVHDTGGGVGIHGAGPGELLQWAESLAAFAAKPPESAFPEFVDRVSTAASREAGREFRERAELCARLLFRLLRAGVLERLQGALDDAHGKAQGVQTLRHEGGVRSLVVEEVTEEEARGIEGRQVAASCLTSVTLCCATHLAHPALPSPWISPGAAKASASTLAHLASGLGNGDDAGAGATAGDERGDALADPATGHWALVHRCLPSWKPLLLSGGGRLDDSRPESYEPDAHPPDFARALASRQLAALVLALKPPELPAALPALVPFLAGTLQDVCVSVQAHGLVTTHALAVRCLPGDLRFTAPLLRHHVGRLTRGCHVLLWPLAAPCLAALAASECGGDPRHEALEDALATLLEEAERHRGDPARRGVFLEALPPLLRSAGLVSLRFASRTLPLLLEWTCAVDLPTVAGALHALGLFVRCAWVRVATHAGALWRSLRLAARNLVEFHGMPGSLAGQVDWSSRSAVYKSDPSLVQETWDGLTAVGMLLWLTEAEAVRATMAEDTEGGGVEGTLARTCAALGAEAAAMEA